MGNFKPILSLLFKKILIMVLIIGSLAGIISVFNYNLQSSYYINESAPILTWNNGDTQTSICVQWETTKPQKSSILYGETNELELGLIENTELTRFHVINLTGLKSNTRYYYQVTTPTIRKYINSKIYSFKTTPDFGDSFKFAVYGDTRDVINGLDAISNGILTINPLPEFVIHVGDLVGTGGDRVLWNQFFLRTAELHASIPLMPVIGNHEYYGETDENHINDDFPSGEYQPEHYLKYFNLPGNERYYAHNISNAHFITLDCAVPGSVFYETGATDNNTQVQWLYDDLVNVNDSVNWIFVSYHVPEKRTHEYEIYTEHGTYRNMTINDVFHESGVDAVFLGHWHTYERQHFELAGRTIPYVISGGGGADLDGGLYWDAEEVEYQAVIFQFLNIVVNGTDFFMESIDINGNVIDSLTLDSEVGIV